MTATPFPIEMHRMFLLSLCLCFSYRTETRKASDAQYLSIERHVISFRIWQQAAVDIYEPDIGTFLISVRHTVRHFSFLRFFADCMR